jgi:hypothetical protein
MARVLEQNNRTGALMVSGLAMVSAGQKVTDHGTANADRTPNGLATAIVLPQNDRTGALKVSGPVMANAALKEIVPVKVIDDLRATAPAMVNGDRKPIDLETVNDRKAG